VITDEVVQAATQAFAGKLCEDREKGITQHQKAMRAALEAIEPMLRGVPDGWKLIETAPKDGKYLIAQYIDETGLEQVCKAAFLSRVWASYDTAYAIEPTHWMPLPAAPKPTHEGE
jgi:hypothetical protein